MKKIQLSVYLDAKDFDRLEQFARTQGQPRSEVAAAAIVALLDPRVEARRDTELHGRLNQQAQAAARIERDLRLTIEMLALFVRSWMIATPPVAEAHRAAAQARGREKFEAFLVAAGRRLAERPAFADQVAARTAAESGRAADHAQAPAATPGSGPDRDLNVLTEGRDTAH